MADSARSPIIVSDEDLLGLISREAALGEKKVERDMTLEELSIESLDVMTILFEVEEKYGLIIEAADLEGCTTIGEVIDIIKARLASGL